MHAIALLQAAISLLLTLQSLGGAVPPELQAQVIDVANNAIAEANAELAAAPTTPTGSAVSPTTDTTTVAQGNTINPMETLECSLSAELVTWSQGTKHAKFSWSFTPGATGVITQDGTDNGPQYLVRYAPGPNVPFPAPALADESSQMNEVYSGTLTKDTSFTLTVSKDGQTKTCAVTVPYE